MAVPHQFPRRIILSRKGWDSSAGGRPSLILQDGTLVSLPIPDRESGVTFQSLRLPNGEEGIGDIVEDLTNRRILRTDEVHLDPDILISAIPRTDFRPAFGQCGRAQSHLENQGVGKETASADADQFLFFGLYCPVMKSDHWHYVPKTPELHVIFGWLQVGETREARTQNAPLEEQHDLRPEEDVNFSRRPRIRSVRCAFRPR